MLNCVLGQEGRRGCGNWSLANGKCMLDYVSGHMINGAEICDQVAMRPMKCDVCGATSGSFHIVGDDRLCAGCFGMWREYTDGRTMNLDEWRERHRRGMQELKALAVRIKANI